MRTCLADCLRLPRRVLGHCVPSAATSWISCSLETTRAASSMTSGPRRCSQRSPETTRVSLPAQNEFYTRPVAHQGHDLAGLGPRYRARLIERLKERPEKTRRFSADGDLYCRPPARALPAVQLEVVDVIDAPGVSLRTREHRVGLVVVLEALVGRIPVERPGELHGDVRKQAGAGGAV